MSLHHSFIGKTLGPHGVVCGSSSFFLASISHSFIFIMGRSQQQQLLLPHQLLRLDLPISCHLLSLYSPISGQFSNNFGHVSSFIGKIFAGFFVEKSWVVPSKSVEEVGSASAAAVGSAADHEGWRQSLGLSVTTLWQARLTIDRGGGARWPNQFPLLCASSSHKRGTRKDRLTCCVAGVSAADATELL